MIISVVTVHLYTKYLKHSNLNADVEVANYKIPKGTILISNVASVMMDSRYFENPDDFKPERFLSQDTGAFEMNPALIPFGIGKRECIGKSLAKIELFLIFSSLMHQFKFMPSSDGKPNLDDVEFSILRIPKPFKVKIENRK